MAIFLTIVFTILFIILIQITLLKLTQPYIKMVFDNAVNVACYVDTYHYTKEEWERIEIGQERYYKSLFKEKSKLENFKRDKTDFIFWVLYTQVFNKLLGCIPIPVNRNNNRCLAEGESRKSEQFLDDYLKHQELEYSSYATIEELRNREDCESVAAEENSEK